MPGRDVHDAVSFLEADKTPRAMYDYIISRAFIPPWSLVTTKPETLGPDAFYQTRKESRNPSFYQTGNTISEKRSERGYSKSPDVFIDAAADAKTILHGKSRKAIPS
jgi:hypothetical protein